MRKKVIFGVIGIVSIFLIIFTFLSRPKNVNQTLYGIMYSGDTVLDENVEVRVKGTYHNSFIRGHSFSGRFEISSIDYSREYDLCTLKFLDNVFEEIGVLIYDLTENGNAKLKSLGNVWIEETWDSIVIQVTDEDYYERSEQNIYLVVPAQNLQEAKSLNMLEKLYNKL